MATQPQIFQVSGIPGSNYQVGRARVIDQITFHHIVGDAPAAIARFRDNTQQVSATYVIGSDGTIYQCVAEKDTPYTDANFDSNSRAITIEHAGGHASVPYTEAMYKASAQLVSWIISRYNITRFMRHRDVSQKPTACPGNLDVERIIREAKSEEIMQSGDIKNIVGAAFMVEADAEDLSKAGQSWHDVMYFLTGKYQHRIRDYAKQGILVAGDVSNFLGAVYKRQPSEYTQAYLGEVAQKGWKEGMYQLANDYQDQIVRKGSETGGGIDQGTKDDIGFIKATVQWIKDKLSSIFK